jgi:hypothetical protein
MARGCRTRRGKTENSVNSLRDRKDARKTVSASMTEKVLKMVRGFNISVAKDAEIKRIDPKIPAVGGRTTRTFSTRHRRRYAQ